jgi:hypothetical protein
MQSWMFLSSYELLRNHILTNKSIVCMAHLGARAFDSIAGEVVQSTAFVLQNIAHRTRIACFVRLTEGNSEKEKASQCLAAVADEQSALLFRACADTLLRIPGQPIAYWMTEQTIRLFTDNPSLGSLAMPRKGNTTTNNDRFLRSWSEVSFARLGIDLPAYDHRFKWIPYNKGGGYRKWFGMNGSVVNWSNNGAEIKAIPHSVVASESLYFQTGLTWSTVSAGRFSVRYFGNGFIFDNGGCCLFSDDARRLYFLALMNSAIFEYLLSKINPTVNFQSGEIAKLPVISLDSINFDLDRNTLGLVNIARADWDNFETSWDFRDQPLLRPGLKGATLEASWRNWDAQSTAAIRRMQGLETENNRLFIAAYGLEGELQPEVPEDQITLARAETRRDMAAFLSYAVGCMMGRYSPDHPGLILANAGDTLREFLEKVGKPLAELTFAPDEDGIIPVLDGEWFEDDIVARIKEFLRVTFSEATLVGNIAFIEDALGKDLRTYFLNDFYKDHLQTYKNRPIYWQLSSGKQKAFQCLVYLHRYTPATLARIRTEYAIPLQGKLSARISRLEEEVIQATSSNARKKLQTDLDKSKKQIVELLAFDEQLRSYADQAITLDLDDGVKANYAKLGTLVAEAKKICGTKDD